MNFDLDMPTIKLFTCVCPHCNHEKMAIFNGTPIQARFTVTAVDDTIIKCSECGGLFRRKDGMQALRMDLAGVLERTA